ncbi:LIC12162 family protein [Polynucleobacter sp. MWH-UH2A]|uniref:LIC12162 family transferase n=1 Tax=Polynucleobacter sp. MWH-UH2A TaxID=1855617 RepID=UPI001BFE16CA|nr:LIC12162 family protein [Polynucleobacter sp. MWH-UH2A]QWD64361.1 hypothetical protein IC571_01650 [Polynucleobacter sp. MWH-UH2A]
MLSQELKREKLTLVTTDLIETWPSEGKILLLGEWCRPSMNWEARLEKRGRILVPYHWNDREKLKDDFDLLQNIRQSISPDLATAMNILHGTQHSKKYWDLLMGWWLSVFISVMIDRYSSMKLAALYKPESTLVINTEDDVFSSADTSDFIKLSSESNIWNHALFALILKSMDEFKILVNHIDSAPHRIAKKTTCLTKVKNFLRSTISDLIFFIKRRDKFFLIGTSLPFWRLITLELRLNQIPLLRISWNKENNSTFDSSVRKWKLASKESCGAVEKLIRESLPLFVPTIFIEGYASMSKDVFTRSKSSEAQIIFTTNKHCEDDSFKAFAAYKIEQGSRLIVGEHGGMGVGLFNGVHRYELDIADRYLSAGWVNGLTEKVIPVGNFRIQKKILPSKSGGALIACGNMPKYAIDIRAMAISSQMIDYFEEQFKFINALPQSIREKTTVRLYQSDYGWNQESRWRSKFPNICLDYGKNSLWNIMHHYRIFISTYNATTYLESLSLNFPTIMVWNPFFWENKPEAKPCFDMLSERGIFHTNPQSAAKHLAAIWNDVDGWWYSESVQNARNFFCDHYCAEIMDGGDVLKRVLIQELALSTSGLSKA